MKAYNHANFTGSLIIPRLGSCLAWVVVVVLVDTDDSTLGLLVDRALMFLLVNLIIT